jgi:hypothetical protein
MENYKEIWMDVIGYEGYYQISNLGNVKGLGRFVNGRYGEQFIKQKKLNPTKNSSGYYRVTFAKLKNTSKYIHRLMAETFLPNPKNKRTVNHINGIKTDNRLCNLEWSTDSENHKHAFKLGLKSQKGEKNAFSKLTKKQVLEIKYIHSKITNQKLSKMYNIDPSNISRIRSGKLWKHI